jgi:hypothetical protein
VGFLHRGGLAEVFDGPERTSRKAKTGRSVIFFLALVVNRFVVTVGQFRQFDFPRRQLNLGGCGLPAS